MRPRSGGGPGSEQRQARKRAWGPGSAVLASKVPAGGSGGGRLSPSGGDVLAQVFCSLTVTEDLSLLPTSIYKLPAIAVPAADSRKASLGGRRQRQGNVYFSLKITINTTK